MTTSSPIVPIYTSRGDVEAFLIYPYIYNTRGEWIGWVNQKREVYSILGRYAGFITNEPRILCKRFQDNHKSNKAIPPKPPRLLTPPTVPLAPMMKELYYDTIDVLLDEPERLHTIDSGELREDLD